MDLQFIKIPNYLVWNYEDEEDVLIKKYGDKVVSSLIYIYCSRNLLTNKCSFNQKELIEFLGFKPNRNKGKINDLIKQLLLQLQEDNILEDVVGDINKIKISDTITCKFNMFNDIDHEFFKLEVDKIRIIFNSDKANKIDILNTYCYMVSRIKTRSKAEQSSFEHGDTCVTPEEFHDTYEKIIKDLNTSRNTFKSILKDLNQLRLIYHDNIGTLFRDGKCKGIANNVYVKDEEELKPALKRSKWYYEQEGYTIESKPNKQANKAKGLKGKIKQEKDKGKDTTELEEKLKDIGEAELKEIRDKIVTYIRQIKEIEKDFSIKKVETKEVKNMNVQELDKVKAKLVNYYNKITAINNWGLDRSIKF